MRLFFAFSLTNAIGLSNKWSPLELMKSQEPVGLNFKVGKPLIKKEQKWEDHSLWHLSSVMALNEMNEIKGNHKNWKC